MSRFVYNIKKQHHRDWLFSSSIHVNILFRKLSSYLIWHIKYLANIVHINWILYLKKKINIFPTYLPNHFMSGSGRGNIWYFIFGLIYFRNGPRYDGRAFSRVWGEKAPAKIGIFLLVKLGKNRQNKKFAQ